MKYPVRKNLTLHLPLLAFLTILFFIDISDADEKLTENTIFREPFTLKLYIDKKHYYEEKFGRIPFVQSGDVYLFNGDEFGLTVDIQNDTIFSIQYQSDVKKADITLKFTQEVQADDTAIMMLKISNATKWTLKMDALMTIPGRKGICTTTILPIQPGLSDLESWPHAIVQLVLRNIRIET